MWQRFAGWGLGRRWSHWALGGWKPGRKLSHWALGGWELGQLVSVEPQQRRKWDLRPSGEHCREVVKLWQSGWQLRRMGPLHFLEDGVP